MLDWLDRLLDTSDFVPRAACGNWSPGWIALHTGSDVLIWLAYVFIPLVLLAVARHAAARPFRWLILLFAAFILACGTTHLIEALLFYWPTYRLQGVLKAATAAVSWATVFALMPHVRQLVRWLDTTPAAANEPPPDRAPAALVYPIAALVGVAAVLIRYALDPVLGDLHPYSIALLAVTFQAWHGGYGPALVTLAVSGLATTCLFVPPRGSLMVVGLNHQFGVGLFLFTGLGVMVLGEIQHATRRRLGAKVGQLRAATGELATEKRKAEAALAQLDAMVRNAPHGIAYFDADLRYVRVNDTFARANGLSVEVHLNRPLTEVVPHFPPDLLADFRRVLDTGATMTNRLARGPDATWEVTAFAVPAADGRHGLAVIGVDVTAREEAVRRLTDSEAKFRDLADAMPQIVFANAPDGRLEFVNRQWVEYTGRTAAEAEDLATLVPDQDRQLVATAWRTAATTGTPFEAEFRLRRHADGASRWFLSRSVPVRGADGRIVRWYGTSTDIDDHKRNEQALRDAVSQLRQLTEGMPLLMWACRPSGECDYLSRQWVEYTGIPEADQLPYGWMEALHPDDRAGTMAAWRAAVDGQAGYDVEFRIRRHDGEYRWFAVRGIPLRDHDGQIVRWYGSCTDVDDRKQQSVTLERMVTERTAALHRTNAALREQQIFLDAILDNVAEGIVACDADGRLKRLNAAARRMYALPAEPPPDRWADWSRLYAADGVTPLPPDRQPLERAWAGEEVRDAEMMLRTAGGADRYVLCSGVPLRGADGRRFGAVVSMRDMTERRAYERQLLQSTAALKESNEELEKFAYVASHDLQEPLRKIQAFGTRLATKYRAAVGDDGKDSIDRMLDSAGRMRKLIDDLLAFSRVSTKAGSTAQVDLGPLVRAVLSDLEVRVQETAATVTVDPLPTVFGDPSQLRQVFQNLLGNALKFARPGVPPVVRVAAVPFADLPPADRPAGCGWRIGVTDNGIGFAQEYAERIFDLFQRLHGRAQYEGTGLGLAIVRKIIGRHGATVSARGRPGDGATFTIDWPTPPVTPCPPPHTASSS